jgi:glycosyltransferase involved in cell wall biosynthesis
MSEPSTAAIEASELPPTDDSALVTPDEIRRANDTALVWLAEFRKAAGRPLRVLHIGNIANNGYNNAKSQRAYGIEADTICYDYYHVMGTPEWESAQFRGTVDPYLPDWWSVEFDDWERPEWFVQGPLQLCLDHLQARQSRRLRDIRRTRRKLLWAYWQMLEDNARLRCQPRSTYGGGTRALRVILPWGKRRSRWEWILAIKPWFVSSIIDAASPDVLEKLKDEARTMLRGPALRRIQAGKRLGIVDRAVFFVRPAPPVVEEITHPRSEEDVKARDPSLRQRLLISARLASRIAVFKSVHALKKALPSSRKVAPDRSFGRPLSAEQQERRQRAVEALRALYLRHFSEVPETQLSEDLTFAETASASWANVLDYYDIVQGYSTTGYIPLFNGIEKFTAYEHGTIRVIPFENDLQGRLCWLTYKLAPRVFVTNTDVLPSADRIGIAKERVVCLPAAFDVGRVEAFRDANPNINPPLGPVIFFCAARQHWRQGDGSWLKGNDVFLRAAGQVASEGAIFKVILVEWGVDVEESKALIQNLGYAHLVEWVPLKSKTELWKAYCESHAVVDQFTLPAIGGVSLEALALGRRLITHIDTPTLRRFFGAAPPVLNGGTVQEVADQIRAVLHDPDDKAEIGTQGRAWIDAYHSTQRLVALQAAAYRELLEGMDGLRIPSLASDDAPHRGL